MFHKPEITSSAWIRGAIIAGGFIFMVALAQTLFDSPAAVAQLQSWKIMPTPQAYTELYFDDNVSIPTTVTAEPINFDFSIHNVEGQEVTYPYIVSLKDDNADTLVASGNIYLNNGETATIPEELTLPSRTKTAEVVVTLPDQNQSIDFLLGATQ